MSKCPICEAVYDKGFFSKTGKCSECGGLIRDSLDKKQSITSKNATIRNCSEAERPKTKYAKVKKTVTTPRKINKQEIKQSIGIKNDASVPSTDKTKSITKQSYKVVSGSAAASKKNPNNTDEITSSIEQVNKKVPAKDESDYEVQADESNQSESQINTNRLPDGNNDVREASQDFEDEDNSEAESLGELEEYNSYMDDDSNSSSSRIEDSYEDASVLENESEDYDAENGQLGNEIDIEKEKELERRRQITNKLLSKKTIVPNSNSQHKETDNKDVKTSNDKIDIENSNSEKCNTLSSTASWLQKKIDKAKIEKELKSEHLEIDGSDFSSNDDGYYDNTPLARPIKADVIPKALIIKVILGVIGTFSAIAFLIYYA